MVQAIVGLYTTSVLEFFYHNFQPYGNILGITVSRSAKYSLQPGQKENLVRAHISCAARFLRKAT